MRSPLGAEPETRRRLLRIGSLSLSVTSDRPRDEELLAFLFKQRLYPFDGSIAPDGELIIRVRDSGQGTSSDDRLVVQPHADGTLTVGTEIVDATLDTRRRPFELLMSIASHDYSEPAFCTHLSVVMNRVLLALGRAYVHSAAVAFNGRTYLFVGDKAAGKSTLCLTLGRLGAEILSDDHVLVLREGGEYFVSGCEETSRVTPRTEEFIFGRLDVEAQDFGGLTKKEFLLDRFFRMSPYQDFPIHRIFFSRVGQTLRAQRMTKQSAAIELIEKSRSLYRFSGPDDLAEFLDFWTTLASAIPAYELELSADMRDLGQLPELLEA